MGFPGGTIDHDPDLYGVERATFHLEADGVESNDAWDFGRRIGPPRAMRWHCDLQYGPFDDDQRIRWDALIARTMGGYVAMRLHHPARHYPRGVGGGIYWSSGARLSIGGSYSIDGGHLVDGVHAIEGGTTIAYIGSDTARYADSLHMTGLWPSSTAFLPGDHFETGGNLYMVTDTAVSDANGECTVPFVWKLWKPALTGDAINLHKPTGRFVISGRAAAAQIYEGAIGRATLTAVEVPYIS